MYNRFAKMRHRYLREHRNGIYTGMFLDGKLEDHLKEIGEAAEEMFDRLVEQMKKAEGVTEKLKAENQMEWVGRMNSIRSRAEEIVLHVKIVGESTLSIPAYPKGSPVEIIYAYDPDQMVTIEVIDKVADKSLGTFEVDRSSNMSAEEVALAAEIVGRTNVE